MSRHIVIEGNLTRDPTGGYGKDTGKAYTHLDVAVTDRVRNNQRRLGRRTSHLLPGHRLRQNRRKRHQQPHQRQHRHRHRRTHRPHYR